MSLCTLLMFSCLVITTSSRVILTKPGIVLEEAGFLSAYESTDAVAGELVIEKPEVRLPLRVRGRTAILQAQYGNLSFAMEFEEDQEEARCLTAFKLFSEAMETEIEDIDQNLKSVSLYAKNLEEVVKVKRSIVGSITKAALYSTEKDIESKFNAMKSGKNPTNELFIGEQRQLGISGKLLRVEERITEEVNEILGNDECWINLSSFKSDTRYNMDKYRRRVGGIVSASRGDGVHFNLQGVLSTGSIESFVRDHDVFNGTVFKSNPLELFKYSEVMFVDVEVSSKNLVLYFIMSFPFVTNASLFPIYNVKQLGYYVNESGISHCVKHEIPDQVAYHNSYYHDISKYCSNLHSYDLCRLDTSHLSQSPSCFNADNITCPQYPTQCNSNSFFNYRHGILVTTNVTVEIVTTDAMLERVDLVNGSSTYIPWNGTRSVIIGDHIHYNPGEEGYDNVNLIHGTGIKYDDEDLGLFKHQGLVDISTEERLAIKIMNKQKQYLRGMANNAGLKPHHTTLTNTAIIALAAMLGVTGVVVTIMCYRRRRTISSRSKTDRRYPSTGF